MGLYTLLGKTGVLAARVMLSQRAESRLSFHHSEHVKLELRTRWTFWTVLINVIPVIDLLPLTSCTYFSYAPFVGLI